MNQQALNNLSNAWPAFKNAEIEEAWAGVIDVTPDSNPVIDKIKSIPNIIELNKNGGDGVVRELIELFLD